jgi:pilus assembly protein Flp/PilA
MLGQKPGAARAGTCPRCSLSAGHLPRREVIDTVLLARLITNVRVYFARDAQEDDEDGQGLAEYALILALIAIVAIVALLFMGSQVSNKLSVIGNAIDSVT